MDITPTVINNSDDCGRGRVRLDQSNRRPQVMEHSTVPVSTSITYTTDNARVVKLLYVVQYDAPYEIHCDIPRITPKTARGKSMAATGK